MPEEIVSPSPSTPPPTPEPAAPRQFGDFLDEPKNWVSAGDSEAGEETNNRETTAGSEETPLDAGQEESTTEVPAQDKGYSFTGIRPEIVALIKHVAANGEYDLTNPKEFKAARQIAEKENRIRELSTKQEPSAEAKSYLDAFRDPEPGAQEPATAAPQDATQPQTDDNLPAFMKKARAWKSHADVTPDLADAFDLPDGPEKNAAVADTLLAFQSRTFEELHMPQVMSLVEHMLQQRLGPVMNQVQSSYAEQERTQIVEKLSTQKGYEGIFDMFEPVTNGTIKLDGEDVPDTWINRAFASDPEILKAVQVGKNQAETERLTTAWRYGAAFREVQRLRSGKVDPATARTLVATGRSIEKSKRDEFRHGLNSGGSGVPPGDRKESLFGRSSEDGVSMAELFKR